MPHAVPTTSAKIETIIVEPYADITRIRFIIRSEIRDLCPALEVTYHKVIDLKIDARFESTAHQSLGQLRAWTDSASVQAEMRKIVQGYLDGTLPEDVTVRADSELSVGSDSEDDGSGYSLQPGSTHTSAGGMSNGSS